MYQAKSLGKNQISGNPRPRRAPAKLLAAPEELSGAPVVEAPVAEAPVAEAPVAEVPVAEVPVAEVPAAEVPAAVAPAPVAIAVEAPVPAATTPALAIDAAATNGSPHEAHGEDEPDPADVRRQIAAARRNMDPDHQIRRAMDAFLSSPTPSRAEREQSS
jgi:hypothetical protein